MPATDDQREIVISKSVVRSSLKAFVITFLIYGTLSSLYCWSIYDDVIRGGRDAYQLWIGPAVFSLPTSIVANHAAEWFIGLADEHTTGLVFWCYAVTLTLAGSLQWGTLAAVLVAILTRRPRVVYQADIEGIRAYRRRRIFASIRWNDVIQIIGWNFAMNFDEVFLGFRSSTGSYLKVGETDEGYKQVVSQVTNRFELPADWYSLSEQRPTTLWPKPDTIEFPIIIGYDDEELAAFFDFDDFINHSGCEECDYEQDLRLVVDSTGACFNYKYPDFFTIDHKHSPIDRSYLIERITQHVDHTRAHNYRKRAKINVDVLNQLDDVGAIIRIAVPDIRDRN